MKKFVKLNDGHSHLCLGNVILCIRDLSKNKTSTIQPEVFCAIFGDDGANNSTINNYCIGARGIGDRYRQIYIGRRKAYQSDPAAMQPTVRSILTLIDGTPYRGEVEASGQLKALCRKLYNIAKNDFYVEAGAIVAFRRLMDEQAYYACFCEMLMYAVLDKKQPLYESEKTQYVIETLLDRTEVSALDLQNFLLLELSEGVNFTHSIMSLAREGNAYACYRLAMMEYRGDFSGRPRYQQAFEYFSQAARKQHPSALWMLGSMLLRGDIGSGSPADLRRAYEYFCAADALGSVAAGNSLGLCYRHGYGVPRDDARALAYFRAASEKGYAYGYNNLGLYYEAQGEWALAQAQFAASAALGESYGCNRMGEYLRRQGKPREALEYYQRALETGIHGRSRWACYNLGKHYYLCGCFEAGIVRDTDRAVHYFEQCQTLIEALVELLFIYFDRRDMNRVAEYKAKIEGHPGYSARIKADIEGRLRPVAELELPI